MFCNIIIIISAIFIQTISFSQGNNEYITVVNKNPVSDDNDVFQCYTPSTFSIDTVPSYGRTYKIEESDTISESSSWTQRTDKPHRYVTETKWNMGVYFCKIVIDGNTTIVETTKIRRNAEITPSNSKSTLTVNVGEDVTISFDGEPEWDVNWRKNGSLLNDATKEKSMTFNPVNTNDAGIYEVHRVGRRSERRHSFIKLIVRACPRHKWGPPECKNDCEYCYNGGVCDDMTGICLCAHGFNGSTCQNGCGGNRFGWNCEARCTAADIEDDCDIDQFCLPDPYGCSCATGFTGFNCGTECEPGKYGADCTQSCHCNQGGCNRFTGRCTDTLDCAHPWTGDNCQECQAAYYGENCTLNCYKPCTCHRLTGKCLEDSCYYSSHWLKTDCEIGILNTTFLSANNGSQTNVTCRIYNIGGTDVEPSIKTSNSGIETILAPYSTQNEPNIMTYRYTFSVTSVLYSTYTCVLAQGYATAEMVVIPEIFISPSYNGLITMITKSTTSISFKWTAWEETDDGDGPVVGYNLYYKMSNAENWEDPQHHKSLSGTVNGLMLDTNYTFAISAVRPGEGGEGPIKQLITVKTRSLKLKDETPLPVAGVVAVVVSISAVLIMIVFLVKYRMKKRTRENGRGNDSRDQVNTTEVQNSQVMTRLNHFKNGQAEATGATNNRRPLYSVPLKTIMPQNVMNSLDGYVNDSVNKSRNNSGFLASNEELNRPPDDGRSHFYLEVINTNDAR